MLFSAFSFFTLLFVKNKFSYFTFLYLNKTANRNCKDKCISHVSVKSFLFFCISRVLKMSYIQILWILNMFGQITAKIYF